MYYADISPRSASCLLIHELFYGYEDARNILGTALMAFNFRRSQTAVHSRETEREINILNHVQSLQEALPARD